MLMSIVSRRTRMTLSHDHDMSVGVPVMRLLV